MYFEGLYVIVGLMNIFKPKTLFFLSKYSKK